MTKRTPGTGGVRQLPSGRHQAYLTIDGKTRTLGTFDSEPEALEVLDGAREIVSKGHAKPVGGKTFRAFGAAWLDDLELRRRNGLGSMRYQWEKHFFPSRIGPLHLGVIARADIRDVLRGLAVAGLAPGTIKLLASQLRSMFDAAIEDEIITANPAAFRRSVATKKTAESWTYLTPEEQSALLNCPKITAGERAQLMFAIGTGLRVGEMINLRLADLHVDGKSPRVVVRYGTKNGPPKNGQIRTVPLFGMALDGARAWLEILPTYAKENPHHLAFPTPTGCFRERQRPIGYGARRVTRWSEIVKAAGFTRRVRWHDLRHTCASSLVAGWWGRTWSLLETRDLLGHTSVQITQRYAHLAPSALADAAAATDANCTPTARGLVSVTQIPSKQADSTSRSSASG